MQRASREATFLLAASPVLQAPICSASSMDRPQRTAPASGRPERDDRRRWRAAACGVASDADVDVGVQRKQKNGDGGEL